jgi:hypothetical protein
MNEIDVLVKIAEDSSSTYLEKCAGVADAYMADSLSTDEAVEVAGELGIDVADVDAVIEAAYGDVLEKEAGATKEAVGKGVEKLKEVFGINKIKEAKKVAESNKGYGEHYNQKLKDVRKAQAEAAGKIGGAAAGTVATGYGATKLFGKKDKK